jgi:hypothetical protein
VAGGWICPAASGNEIEARPRDMGHPAAPVHCRLPSGVALAQHGLCLDPINPVGGLPQTGHDGIGSEPDLRGWAAMETVTRSDIAETLHLGVRTRAYVHVPPSAGVSVRGSQPTERNSSYRSSSRALSGWA